RGWTLKDVGRLSGGRFKPSAVGGYERGERAITLERFCQIAIMYGTPPDLMLAAALEASGAVPTREIMIDLSRLGRLEANEREAIDALVRYVSARRARAPTERIRIRWGDLVILAEAAAVPADELIGRLRPALVRLTDL